MELGSDFAFIGRLKCLVIVDLKLGKFTHADAGQMHMYLNYAREHWTRPDATSPTRSPGKASPCSPVSCAGRKAAMKISGARAEE